MDHQHSGSYHDREEGEDEQVLQPKIKRKRSLRVRPRNTIERPEEKSGSETRCVQRGDSSVLPSHVDHKSQPRIRGDPDVKSYDQGDSSSKRRNLPTRRAASASKMQPSAKSGRLNNMSDPADAVTPYRENREGKAGNTSGTSGYVTKMPDIIQRRCKNVISKLQRRLDKEGPQIVPLLTDLWKRIENSGYTSGVANNIIDLRKIDQRIEQLEYNGVMELVSDVQSMLRSSMQYYGFSHEVRTEARKVHDLFFDILKIAFADTDFRESRITLSFNSPVVTTNAPSPRSGVGQSKRQKLINEVEPDSVLEQKPLRGSIIGREETRVRSHMSQKESRLGSGSGSAREHYQPDDSPLLAHPGDLVICKKKRKDREKIRVKTRNGAGGPVSPPSMGRGIRSPGPNSVTRETRSTQQASHPQGWANQPSPSSQPSNRSAGSVGWANPVKRLRTDSGKRRPSHL